MIDKYCFNLFLPFRSLFKGCLGLLFLSGKRNLLLLDKFSFTQANGNNVIVIIIKIIIDFIELICLTNVEWGFIV
jgi:hypothetical protein